MKPNELPQYLLAVTIVGLIVLLLFSQLLGQPFVVFVETGSMAPTLEPNDGYLAMPMFFAGEIREGDVILFDSQELGGGELTTHRVEAITDEGYITRGDANPFTDQDGDEPPVAEGQIRSVALQPTGELVVIPGLGATVVGFTSVVESTQERITAPLGVDTLDVTTVSTVIMLLGLLVYIFSVLYERTNRRSRSRSDGNPFDNAVLIIALLTLVVILPVNVSMLLPSGVYQYEIISSASPTDDEQIIQAGGSGEVTYVMQNSGHLPTVVFLEPAGDGVDVPPEQLYLPRRTTLELPITMHAPDETGSYLRFVREHRYLVVLPPSVIAALHAIHPLVAMAAINLTVATVVVSVSVLSIGTGRLRLRSRQRDITVGEEIRRLLPSVLLVSGSSAGRKKRTDRRTRSTPPPQRPTAPSPPTAGVDKPVTEPATPNDERLTADQRYRLYETLRTPPSVDGAENERAGERETQQWTPEAVQKELRTAFDLDYPVAYCAWLLTQSRQQDGYETDSDRNIK